MRHLDGAHHLRTVIMTIVETKPNKRALIAPVIWAVSDVPNAYPDWFGCLVDDIDLTEMFERVVANRRVGPAQAAGGSAGAADGDVMSNVTPLLEHMATFSFGM